MQSACFAGHHTRMHDDRCCTCCVSSESTVGLHSGLEGHSTQDKETVVATAQAVQQ